MLKSALIGSVMALSLVSASSFAAGVKTPLTEDNLSVAEVLLNNHDQISKVLLENGIEKTAHITEGYIFDGANPLIRTLSYNFTVQVCLTEGDCDVVGLLIIAKTTSLTTRAMPQTRVTFQAIYP
jgi:hypothetical protein